MRFAVDWGGGLPILGQAGMQEFRRMKEER
jgi:hypothetical protein